MGRAPKEGSLNCSIMYSFENPYLKLHFTKIILAKFTVVRVSIDTYPFSKNTDFSPLLNFPNYKMSHCKSMSLVSVCYLFLFLSLSLFLSSVTPSHLKLPPPPTFPDNPSDYQNNTSLWLIVCIRLIFTSIFTCGTQVL